MTNLKSVWRCDTKVHRTVLQHCSCSSSEGSPVPAPLQHLLPSCPVSTASFVEAEGKERTQHLLLSWPCCSQQLLGREGRSSEGPTGTVGEQCSSFWVRGDREKWYQHLQILHCTLHPRARQQHKTARNSWKWGKEGEQKRTSSHEGSRGFLTLVGTNPTTSRLPWAKELQFCIFTQRYPSWNVFHKHSILLFCEYHCVRLLKRKMRGKTSSIITEKGIINQGAQIIEMRGWIRLKLWPSLHWRVEFFYLT